MEHPALTREQVEAMDETMTFATHRVTQPHRRDELSQHFAPGVIEHHARITWVDISIMLVVYVLGAALLASLFALGAWLAGVLVAWLAGLDWSALAFLVGKS